MRLAASWVLAAATALALFLAWRRPAAPGAPWRAAGLAVMSVPAWSVLLAVAPDAVRTFCEAGDVAAVVGSYRPPAPFTHLDLSVMSAHSILRMLGHVAVGAALYLQGRDPGWWRAPTTHRMAAGLRGLVPPWASERGSLLAGLAWFPVLAAGNLVMLTIVGTPLDSAGMGPRYGHATAYHALLLALAAGVGEEIVYRGIMQGGLAAALTGRGLDAAQRRRRNAWLQAAAAVPVALVFAFAHTSYGDWALFQFAFLFSLAASAAAVLHGLWAAIALHALIDFYAFFVSVPAPGPAFVGVAVALALVAVASSVAVTVRAVRPWMRA